MNQEKEITLKYGVNPHQKNAKVKGNITFTVLNGNPGSVNTMEVLRGWSLVDELDLTFNMPAAAALKHKNPAGAAISVPLNDRLKEFYSCRKEMSDLATSFYRAFGTDPKSAYGGTVVLSRDVDYATALAIKPRVIDVVVAPGFDDDALELLKSKKDGNLLIVQHERDYEVPETVTVNERGAVIEYDRNLYKVTDDLLEDNLGKPLTEEEIRDLKLGVVISKYTKSNKTVYTLDGQSTGIMPCQQSRVDSIKWAGEKAMYWLLRQGIARDEYTPKKLDDRVSREISEVEYMLDGKYKAERRDLINNGLKKLNKGKFRAVTCGFLPFSDCVTEADNFGVGTILYPKSPVKGIRFETVAKEAKRLGINIVLFPYRLFEEI